MSRAHSIGRRARCNGARRRPERAGRSGRKALPRPDRHAGERLSRGTAGRIEPAAFVGPDALAAGATLRHFSPGGAGVQPSQERLLDLSCRPHETQPGDQGSARPPTGPPRRGFTSGSALVRTERHPAGCRRDRASDCNRLSHGLARPYHQPRPARLDYREALRGGPPAMSELRPQEGARPKACAGTDRAWRRRQAGHDERGVPDRFAEGHGCTFPQACEPADGRGLASRTDRRRPAVEHQLPCRAQFFGARHDGP